MRALLGLNRSQWQRLRTRADFPEPIPYGSRIGHSPTDMLAYLHRLAALTTAKTLQWIARKHGYGFKALTNWSKESWFPRPVGVYRGLPAYIEDDAVTAVKRATRFMKPPKDFADKRPRRIVARPVKRAKRAARG